MEGVDRSDDQWAMISALKEPQRRVVYSVVLEGDEPLTRDDAARAAGISRSLAAFHLDKLVEAGLLEVATQPSAGRRRPAIGRPAKRYRRSSRQVELTVPPRRYALAGQILVAALGATEAGRPAVDAATSIAGARGRELARPAGERRREPDVLGAAATELEMLGYLPLQQEDRIILANCPFHALVQVDQKLTCQMNLALIGGLVAGLGVEEQLTPLLAPQSGRCCVTLLRTDPDEKAVRQEPADR